MSDAIDTPAPAISADLDLIRKRSRSSSPGGIESESPGAAKKANLDPSVTALGPSTLSKEIKSEEGLSSSAPVVSATDAVAPQSEEEDVKHMVIDSVGADLPANPTLVEGGSNAEADAAAAAAAAASTIQMRALIVTQDASIIIGKSGKNVNEIREKSGSKITISETVVGNPERVMMIAGQLDAVSKAFGLVVRRINDEPFDVPSVPGSRAVTIRFIIPNSRMGSVIGKAGSKIKEIQEASGARLQASEAMLPGSTERVLSVSGVADAIHIAVYYIGTILQEHPLAPTTHASHTSYRPAGTNQSYNSGGGDYNNNRSGGGQQSQPRQQQNFGSNSSAAGGQTQQIFIPNELVGSIIGKGGAKINEIRQLSQCQIKICEPGEGSPGANPLERLVTIQGSPSGIQMAITILYQRLEAEKAKQLGGS